MARCPLCSDRPAKRFCPAKETTICPVCCGTKREVEIDCPGACPYLRNSRDYEAEKRLPDPELMARVQAFDRYFVQRYTPAIDSLSRAVVEERRGSSWLVDADVLEVYKALSATIQTLSSGIHYESLPEGSVRISLFRRLKTMIDDLMQLDPDASGEQALKVSEILQILDFLTLVATLNSNTRPRTRQYLDLLANMAGVDAPEPSGRLIVP